MRIVLLGLPGAGKGTQANLLSSYLKVPHLSTGEILRSKLNDKDELSMKLKNTMSSGNLVSDNILNSIVSDKLLSDECKNGFILENPTDPNEISKLLNHCLTLKDRESISKSARDLASEFSLELNMKETEKLYFEIYKNKKDKS